MGNVRKINTAESFDLKKQDSEKKTGLPVKKNRTGLPEYVKEGAENLSGISLDDVRVHYNSRKPAEIQALAYTQGVQIHVAPGQERHLPHEVWHVVQQKQGRVTPTGKQNGRIVNDDPALEREADVMGDRAVLQRHPAGVLKHTDDSGAEYPIQRKLVFRGKEMASSDVSAFKTQYNAHKDDCDDYTNESNHVEKISEEMLKENKSFENYVKSLIKDDDYYYIGNKNAIVRILTEMYYKLEPYYDRRGEAQEVKRENIIKRAIARMYSQENKESINGVDLNKLNKYSKHLIDLVAQKVIPNPSGKGFNIREYRLSKTGKQQTINVRRGKMITGKNSNESNGSHERYRLEYGEYIYRSMSREEVNGLIAKSTRNSSNGRYTFNATATFRGSDIGAHLGNLTQAVTYSGILVRFKMKSNFNSNLSDEIAGGGEGSGGGGKIGFKGEHEGMLERQNSLRSFSFCIKGVDSARNFLNNVEYFEVFNLGKIVGSKA